MMSFARQLPPAFLSPRYRLFAAGQIVSVLGTWIQQVALAWLVFRLTGSVFFLGLSGFLLQIPHLFVAPVAGFVIDRLPRVRLLICVNLALCVLAFSLAALTLAGDPDVALVFAFALAIGIANAIESPTRQALLGAIVEDRALLPSAIGFNSVVFNTGRLVGPAIAGVLLLRVSEGWCFMLNAASFLAVVAALMAMRLSDAPAGTRRTAERHRLRESLDRLKQLPVARYLLPNASAVALFALPVTHLMPSIVVTFFQGDQGTVGLCISASGFGALVTAALLSMQRGHSLHLKLVQIAPFVGGIALLAFSQSRSLWLSLPLIAVIGGCSLATSVSTNTLLQQSVEDAWRGRVIGLYFMCFVGIAPIGNLLAGAVASHIGLPVTLAIGGAMMVLAAAIARLRLARDPAARRQLRESLQR
jgi:MFS family permease